MTATTDRSKLHLLALLAICDRTGTDGSATLTNLEIQELAEVKSERTLQYSLMRLRELDYLTVTYEGGRRFWVTTTGWTKALELIPGLLVRYQRIEGSRPILSRSLLVDDWEGAA